MAGDGMLKQCREVVDGLGVALHLQLAGGGPDDDVLVAVVADGLQGGHRSSGSGDRRVIRAF
jgi:hypothetical protein